MILFRRKCLQKFVNRSTLRLSFLMAAVGHDRNDASGLHQIDRFFYRGQRGIFCRHNRLVASRHKSEIKDESGNFSGNLGQITVDLCMRIADQTNVCPLRISDAVFRQINSRSIESFLLNIKGIHCAPAVCASDRFRQGKGIVSVSHGTVHHRIPRRNIFTDDMHR